VTHSVFHDGFQALFKLPRYFVPATISERSRARMRLSARMTEPHHRLCAAPALLQCCLAHAGSRIALGCFSFAAGIWMTRSIRHPDHQRIQLVVIGRLGKSTENSRSTKTIQRDVRLPPFPGWCVPILAVVESRKPRSCKISPQTFSRSRPNRRCSVPICRWKSRQLFAA